MDGGRLFQLLITRLAKKRLLSELVQGLYSLYHACPLVTDEVHNWKKNHHMLCQRDRTLFCSTITDHCADALTLGQLNLLNDA